MNMPTSKIADEKNAVAAIYEKNSITESYLDKRLQFTWQRLLHRKQVEAMNDVLAVSKPESCLEVAPGPARLAVELKGIRRGVMVENSQEMVAIANRRLHDAGIAGVWEVRKGDAFALSASIPASSVDLVYTFRFLRHFRTQEREQLYRELSGCLKPGGLLVFDVVGSREFKRVEARNPERPAGEIAIYDVTYDEQEFRAEMERNGFSVVRMLPILKHFSVQSWLSYKGDDRAPAVVGALVEALEMLPHTEPLEWVAVCKKR